jgi:hypothetical protein
MEYGLSNLTFSLLSSFRAPSAAFYSLRESLHKLEPRFSYKRNTHAHWSVIFFYPIWWPQVSSKETRTVQIFSRTVKWSPPQKAAHLIASSLPTAFLCSRISVTFASSGFFVFPQFRCVSPHNALLFHRTWRPQIYFILLNSSAFPIQIQPFRITRTLSVRIEICKWLFT